MKRQCGRCGPAKNTSRGQLAELFLKPADIRYLARSSSHSHPDHVVHSQPVSHRPPCGAKGRVTIGQTVWWPAFFQAGAAGHQGGRHRDLFWAAAVMLISTPGPRPSPMPARQVAQDRAVAALGDLLHTKPIGQPSRARAHFQHGPSRRLARPHGCRVLRDNAQLWIGQTKPEEVPAATVMPPPPPNAVIAGPCLRDEEISVLPALERGGNGIRAAAVLPLVPAAAEPMLCSSRSVDVPNWLPAPREGAGAAPFPPILRSSRGTR